MLGCYMHFRVKGLLSYPRTADTAVGILVGPDSEPRWERQWMIERSRIRLE